MGTDAANATKKEGDDGQAAAYHLDGRQLDLLLLALVVAAAQAREDVMEVLVLVLALVVAALCFLVAFHEHR